MDTIQSFLQSLNCVKVKIVFFRWKNNYAYFHSVIFDEIMGPSRAIKGRCIRSDRDSREQLGNRRNPVGVFIGYCSTETEGGGQVEVVGLSALISSNSVCAADRINEGFSLYPRPRKSFPWWMTTVLTETPTPRLLLATSLSIIRCVDSVVFAHVFFVRE